MCKILTVPSCREWSQIHLIFIIFKLYLHIKRLYCSVQNKKLKLKFFSARPLPCHSSPLSLFSFFLLIDLTQRLSGKGSAPGYKHPRSVVLCPWWFTTLQEPWCRCILFYHARVFPFSFILYLLFFRFPFSLITMGKFLSNF